jgi:hypothetical protein
MRHYVFNETGSVINLDASLRGVENLSKRLS